MTRSDKEKARLSDEEIVRIADEIEAVRTDAPPPDDPTDELTSPANSLEEADELRLEAELDRRHGLD